MVLVLLATAVTAGGVAIHKHRKHKKARKAALLNTSNTSSISSSSTSQLPRSTREPVYRESEDMGKFAPPNYLQHTTDQKLEALDERQREQVQMETDAVRGEKGEEDDLPEYVVGEMGSVRVEEELERQDTRPTIPRRSSARGKIV